MKPTPSCAARWEPITLSMPIRVSLGLRSYFAHRYANARDELRETLRARCRFRNRPPVSRVDAGRDGQRRRGGAGTGNRTAGRPQPGNHCRARRHRVCAGGPRRLRTTGAGRADDRSLRLATPHRPSSRRFTPASAKRSRRSSGSRRRLRLTPRIWPGCLFVRCSTASDSAAALPGAAGTDRTLMDDLPSTCYHASTSCRLQADRSRSARAVSVSVHYEGPAGEACLFSGPPKGGHAWYKWNCSKSTAGHFLRTKSALKSMRRNHLS